MTISNKSFEDEDEDDEKGDEEEEEEADRLVEQWHSFLDQVSKGTEAAASSVSSSISSSSVSLLRSREEMTDADHLRFHGGIETSNFFLCTPSCLVSLEASIPFVVPLSHLEVAFFSRPNMSNTDLILIEKVDDS